MHLLPTSPRGSRIVQWAMGREYAASRDFDTHQTAPQALSRVYHTEVRLPMGTPSYRRIAGSLPSQMQTFPHHTPHFLNQSRGITLVPLVLFRTNPMINDSEVRMTANADQKLGVHARLHYRVMRLHLGSPESRSPQEPHRQCSLRALAPGPWPVFRVDRLVEMVRAQVLMEQTPVPTLYLDQ